MDKTILMVYNSGCSFKEKGQDVNCPTSGRKNAVSMSVTLYFTLPFETVVLKKFGIKETYALGLTQLFQLVLPFFSNQSYSEILQRQYIVGYIVGTSEQPTHRANTNPLGAGLCINTSDTLEI